MIFIFEGPRCNGFPKTEWDCCNPVSQCGLGEGDCDTDDDCYGDLICGGLKDKSNNCKNDFAYPGIAWMDKADCCTKPGKLWQKKILSELDYSIINLIKS